MTENGSGDWKTLLLIWSEVVQLQLFVFSRMSAAFFKTKVISMHEVADLRAKRVDYFLDFFFFQHSTTQIFRMYTAKSDRLSGGC